MQCLAFLNQREFGEIVNSSIRVSQGSCIVFTQRNFPRDVIRILKNTPLYLIIEGYNYLELEENCRNFLKWGVFGCLCNNN